MFKLFNQLTSSWLFTPPNLGKIDKNLTTEIVTSGLNNLLPDCLPHGLSLDNGFGSAQTVRNRLHEDRLHARRPV